MPQKTSTITGNPGREVGVWIAAIAVAWTGKVEPPSGGLGGSLCGEQWGATLDPHKSMVAQKVLIRYSKFLPLVRQFYRH